MHPEVVDDRAGRCPICKMPLEPIRLDTAWSCPVHAVIVEAAERALAGWPDARARERVADRESAASVRPRRPARTCWPFPSSVNWKRAQKISSKSPAGHDLATSSRPTSDLRKKNKKTFTVWAEALVNPLCTRAPHLRFLDPTTISAKARGWACKRRKHLSLAPVQVSSVRQMSTSRRERDRALALYPAPGVGQANTWRSATIGNLCYSCLG